MLVLGKTVRGIALALALTVLCMPYPNWAQQPAKVWRVGVLLANLPPSSLDSSQYGPFQRRLAELGYVEGKNASIVWRFAENRDDRLAPLARELLQLKVDVIVAGNPTTGRAAQKATSTIPIVIVNTGDPVANGFAKSLAHPGRNITGLTVNPVEVSPKYLEFLRLAAPKLSRVAVLKNLGSLNEEKSLSLIQSAARSLGVEIASVNAGTPAEIESGLQRVQREGVRGLIVLMDGFFLQQRVQIANLAVAHRMASIFPPHEYAEAGGLMSYGRSNGDNYRRAAEYVDKILKGTPAGTLPFEEPTKFELVVNKNTAKAIGLTLPQELLLRADRVIE